MIKRQRQIRERINIQNFLNFIIKKIYDHEENIIETIITRYNSKRETKLDEEVKEIH